MFNWFMFFFTGELVCDVNIMLWNEQQLNK